MATVIGQHRTFYLLPDDQPLSNCPVENCYSLDGASVFADDFFASDTTIALVEGTHVYSNFNDQDEVLIIASVHNFTLTVVNQNAGATIKCNGSVAFKFMYVRYVTISGITFEECGADVLHLSDYFVSATLHIMISCNIAIKNITITKGRAFGLLAYNAHGYFVLENSNFDGNELNFGMFKLPIHAHFTCATSSQRFVIMQSNFINGKADPNEDINYYYTFSSGIALITFSAKDPSHNKANILIKDVILYKNTGLMGNIYIEYNACTTGVHIENLNSSDCDIGAYLRPRLWRSTYCIIHTAWGIASITMSVLSNASLYLSVPQDDTLNIDDLLETEDPYLNYVHAIALQNVTIVNYNGGDKTLFLSYVHQVLLSDVTLENNIGQDLMVLIESEILLDGQCIFRRNIGGIAVYLNTRLIFTENSSIQILGMYDDFNFEWGYGFYGCTCFIFRY